MENIKAAFEKIEIKKWACDKGERFFDPIRKNFVFITPEERVRQRMIQFLINDMAVPIANIRVEDHLTHFGIKNSNRRIDIALTYFDKGGYEQPLAVIECKKGEVSIEAGQVLEQACDYAMAIGCRYFIVVNGVNIQFYHKYNKGFFQPLNGILTYDEMLNDSKIIPVEPVEFERLTYDDYFDLDSLKDEEWYYYKIGLDTDEKLVPFIINLDDCLLDTACELPKIESKRFSLVEDLGTEYRQYGDASGGSFGSEIYRLFLVNDTRAGKQFISGFAVSAAGKTVDDPKYGTVDGKSVLIIMYNDGNTDEMSVQINMNRFLSVDKCRKIHLTHNGAVTRKGASKSDFLAFLRERTDNLVKNNQIDFGYADCSKSLTLQNEDVILLISRLIEYSAYRNEYKKKFSG